MQPEIQLIAPEIKGRITSLRMTDDRLIVNGNMPHGYRMLPHTRIDRDRLILWLKSLDYSNGAPITKERLA